MCYFLCMYGLVYLTVTWHYAITILLLSQLIISFICCYVRYVCACDSEHLCRPGLVFLICLCYVYVKHSNLIRIIAISKVITLRG